MVIVIEIVTIKKIAGNNDLYVSIYSRGPHYIRNFFGIGNETIFPDEGNRKITYYRTRFDYVTAEARLRLRCALSKERS